MIYCSFCQQPNIIHCMNRSLYHKHSEDQDKTYHIIESLIKRQHSPVLSKFTEVVLQSDRRQFMNIYLRKKMLVQQFKDLLEYYKYRFFVPLFAKSYIAQRVISYYYQTLKHYYNNIKKKLNITIQYSSQSQTESYMSRQNTNLSTKQELLKDLKKQQEAQKKKQKQKLQSLVSYKTQSKALEQLVCYLKLNPKFQQVKTLKTQDCFQEQNIFKQTVQHKQVLKSQTYHHEHIKANIKSKLFKKILQGAYKKEVPMYQAQKSRQRPPSRSKSIKFVKFRQTKHAEKSRQKNEYGTIFKPLEIRPKESNSVKSINKRNSSLTKITDNHYTSPYHKKASSTDKSKAVTAFLSKAGRSSSTDNIKMKTIQNKQRNKTKDSGVVSQANVIQFPKTIPYKSTPSSPTSKKIPRPQIKLTKNDNILTIRKKKLDALREKAIKK